MKSTDPHTIWLRKPDGSQMKISTEGQLPHGVLNYIAELKALGWVVVPPPKWDVVAWVKSHLFLCGGIAGITLSNLTDLIFGW